MPFRKKQDKTSHCFDITQIVKRTKMENLNLVDRIHNYLILK